MVVDSTVVFGFVFQKPIFSPFKILNKTDSLKIRETSLPFLYNF